MRLERSPYFTAASLTELPTPEEFQANTAKMLETLKNLRDAPVVDEDYRGPVLFSADAASDIFNGMVGGNVLGKRPRPGESARTTGDYASNYKSRVLPTFISVEDDPTLKTFAGKTLIGSYDADDEGVRAVKVSAGPGWRAGELPAGPRAHSRFSGIQWSRPRRAGPVRVAQYRESDRAVEAASLSRAIKEKLLDICREENKAFGYYVETLGGTGYEPRLLYRIYEKDGHQELVRGAVFDELDTRALRNDLVAAGNDQLVGNREGAVPTTVISPSILFDDLEVKRTDAKNAKLPEYPAPDLTSAR